MDPLAAILSAYMNSVSDAAVEHTRNVLGTDVQAEVVEYRGVRLTFQYQMWRVIDSSVCAGLKSNVGEYSKCTLATKAFFSDACHYMNENVGHGWKYQSYKRLYCNAATSYAPTVALVSEADEETTLELARKECNSLVAESLGNDDPILAKRKNVTCEKYNRLKGDN